MINKINFTTNTNTDTKNTNNNGTLPDNNSNETLFPGYLVIKDDFTKNEDADNNLWCNKFINKVMQQELGKQN